MRWKFKLLCVVLALQATWILATTFVQEHALRSGVTVMLETRPVDPRDLLRGDYLILNYKISDIPVTLFTPAVTNNLEGQTIYVALERKADFHQVVAASTKPFAPGPNQVLLKGQSEPRWNSTSVHVIYGLERYYVREGTGNPRGKITVQVAVTGSGRGLIRQVFLDGKAYAEAMKSKLNEDFP